MRSDMRVAPAWRQIMPSTGTGLGPAARQQGWGRIDDAPGPRGRPRTPAESETMRYRRSTACYARHGIPPIRRRMRMRTKVGILRTSGAFVRMRRRVRRWTSRRRRRQRL